MRLDVKFRLSVYLSLVLASACLGQAEEAFLPGVLVFIMAVGLLFALAFTLEGRWSLTIVSANLLGMVIAAGAGFWIFFHLIKPPSGLGSVAPWPALLLPYLGPVLMCLLLAKLFRPKQVNDFWLLHTVGLMEVILACVLASDPLFGALLLAYVVCALWSLSLFHVYRERLRAGSEANAAPPAALHPLRRAVGWSLAIGALSLLFFLMTPPLGESAWNPFVLNRNGVMVQSFADRINLNRTGKIQESDEVAFHVHAKDAAGRPVDTLSREQRWRGAVLDYYDQGHWISRALTSMAKGQDSNAKAWEFPRPRPEPVEGQLALAILVPEATNALFLADPVWLPRRGNVLPIAALQSEKRRSWYFQAEDQTLAPTPISPTTGYHYQQIVLMAQEPGISSPLRYEPQLDSLYFKQPIPGIKVLAAEMVLSLQKSEALTSEDARVVGDDVGVNPEKWEKVARAIEEHLRTAKEYGYTLQLRRKDMSLDPTEDFLRNIKQGHCERFASALALLLRSCRIPARLVVGFRGLEASQEPGEYVVRQYLAHSWVEVAVPRKDADGVEQWHWLTLDPTPATDPEEEANQSRLHGWESWKQLGGLLWRNFVVDYNSEKRSEAGTALAESVGVFGFAAAINRIAQSIGPVGGAALTVLIALMWLMFRKLPRRTVTNLVAAPAPATFGSELYARLLVILEHKLELSPKPSQTPLEFACLAESALAGREVAATLAQLPQRVVALLYRVHFGQRAPGSGEVEELDRDLKALDAALVLSPGGAAERSPG
jgi:hypothetical protein